LRISAYDVIIIGDKLAAEVGDRSGVILPKSEHNIAAAGSKSKWLIWN
jgi:hypothetical protein